MPRLIDHSARAQEIVEAAWRVLVRGGVPAVSVRNVAAEAGLATASLRRSFPTQSELLVGCLTLMGSRVEARIRALPQAGTPVDQAVAMLAETVPLDDERRVEMEVYLALGVAALSDGALAGALARTRGDLAGMCRLVVDGLAQADPADPAELADGSREREVLHLMALVDGLALQVLLGHDAHEALEVLRSHVVRLAAAP